MKFFVVTDDGKTAAGGCDSAVLRHGEPVFLLPGDRSLSIVAAAVRISRLGTHIPIGKARAYYDAAAPVHLLYPPKDSVPTVPPFFCDRALSPGTWTDADSIADDTVMEIAIADRTADTILDSRSISLAALHRRAADAIARISKFATLKTGDVIVFTDIAGDERSPEPDTTVIASINGVRLLDIKIK